MRFLILIDAADAAEADQLALAGYHEELVRAGVLLAGDLTAGFWLVEVTSADAAAEWGRRLPCANGAEIRQVALPL